MESALVGPSLSICSFIEDYETSTLHHLDGLREGLKQPLTDIQLDEHAASSIILVYLMTDRFVKYGETLQEFLSINLNKEDAFLCSNKTQYLFTEKWPGKLENEFMVSLLLSTYKFHDLYVDPSMLLQQLSQESQTPAQISGRMAYAVSKIALEQQDYVQAFDWLNYALKLKTLGDYSISRRFLIEKKENMIYRHNIDRKIYENKTSGFYARRISVEDIRTGKEKLWVRSKELEARHFQGRKDYVFGEINMWVLCTKRNIQKEYIKAKLRCHLDNKKHPSFYIKPLRVEVHSESPLILQFHDIIGDKLMNTIINDLDVTNKQISAVGDLLANDAITPSDFIKMAISVRSSVNAWFGDDIYPELSFISEAVTGLKSRTTSSNVNETEMFQAVEYTAGRSYKLHIDTTTEDSPDIQEEMRVMGGLRMATLLYYLNDVPRGGYTAFLNAGVAVPPKKGSAVYWENHYRNGTARLDSWHASCPVLYGRKMVINKWFRSNMQFRTFPCSLNQSI
ncbi:unnamed protein product [Orchesella dallaii]|uniref:Fe2OG dioxygenase domain-containing protein n=1 Tax=Orchesella dallaii TaxID=48710 RepID=A0ABP1QEM5_9HEXA